jgi:hypothetical protein
MHGGVSATVNTILLLQKTMKGRHLTASLFLMRENPQGKVVKDAVRGVSNIRSMYKILAR